MWTTIAGKVKHKTKCTFSIWPNYIFSPSMKILQQMTYDSMASFLQHFTTWHNTSKKKNTSSSRQLTRVMSEVNLESVGSRARMWAMVSEGGWSTSSNTWTYPLNARRSPLNTTPPFTLHIYTKIFTTLRPARHEFQTHQNNMPRTETCLQQHQR